MTFNANAVAAAIGGGAPAPAPGRRDLRPSLDPQVSFTFLSGLRARTTGDGARGREIESAVFAKSPLPFPASRPSPLSPVSCLLSNPNGRCLRPPTTTFRALHPSPSPSRLRRHDAMTIFRASASVHHRRCRHRCRFRSRPRSPRFPPSSSSAGEFVVLLVSAQTLVMH